MGSSIDDFLKEEGIFEEAQAQAVKEVVAWQLAKAMKKKKNSKARMAALLKTRYHAGEFATGGGIGGAEGRDRTGLSGPRLAPKGRARTRGARRRMR
jgi:hypothetical protein